jgi:hypothetical protein
MLTAPLNVLPPSSAATLENWTSGGTCEDAEPLLAV